MLEKHGIGYHEKENGQLFCNEGSGAVINMLRKECGEAGVEIHLNCQISEIDKQKLFKVTINSNAFLSGSLVIATGGLSYPKLGATGFGHKIAEKFGLMVTPLKPAPCSPAVQPERPKQLQRVERCFCQNKGKLQ